MAWMVGFLAGVLVTGALVLAAFRKAMISKFRVDAPFDKVCENVEAAITSVHGWAIPVPMWSAHAAISKHYPFKNLKNLKVFFSCKAEYANRILEQFPFMAGVMPCSWAVYETMDGQVYIAKMNIPLMAKVFAGNVVGRTMAAVGREEEQMRAALLSRLNQGK